MESILKIFKIIIVLLLLLTNSPIFSQANDYTPQHTCFNINNISTIIYNDGRMDYDIEGEKAAFEYPKGSGKTIVKQSGFLWGGVVQGEIRVGGSTYRTGLKPGRILPEGTAEDPNSEKARIYNVKRSYLNHDFSDEIEKGEGTYEEIKTRFEKDWNEWPAEWGAPFEDVDGNGKYDPSIDIPGVEDADQTIWFVANDCDENQTEHLYGSLPLGVEMQTTIWGYRGYWKDEYPEDTYYIKYKIINKNPEGFDFEEMYFAYFSDPDIGYFRDDFVGCDTLLNMGFAFNGATFDNTYKYETPAVGYTILQEPANVESITQSKTIDYEEYGDINKLGYGRFCFFVEGDPIYVLPREGEYARGTIGFYLLFEGRICTICYPPNRRFYNPLAGDPIKRTGWIDGMMHPPGERQFVLSSGPFDLKYGESNEITYAVVAAGAQPNMINLDALSLLKWRTRKVREEFNQPNSYSHRPYSPVVEATQLDREIILSWGEWSDRQDYVKHIESQDEEGYKFQGYNIYQLQSASSWKDDARLIATYDVVDGIDKIVEEFYNYTTHRVETRLAHNGSDRGLERYIKLDWDYIKGQPLINDNRYYYAVTAYNYNDEAGHVAKSYENSLCVFTVTPQSPKPGIRYESNCGDQIPVTHLYSVGSADVDVMVIDPTKVTGHRYEITFHQFAGNLNWQLEDVTLGELKLTEQTNITGTNKYYIVDGIRIIITQDETDPLTNDDIFSFTSPRVIEDTELAKLDVDKINVFPNPYYGANPQELGKHSYFVTLNHLPKKATVKIFNLAGQLVRSLKKYDDGQFLRWDLQNEHRLLVPAGLYIIHVDMPELGKVKILKLALVQRTVIPDRIGAGGYVKW